MSLVVLAIAVAPAVIVVIVAGETHSRAKTVFAAVVAAAVGVFTGNPAYMLLDLVCVAAALVVGWKMTDSRQYQTAEQIAAEEARRRAEQEASERQWREIVHAAKGLVILGAAAAAGAYFWFFMREAPADRAGPASYSAAPSPGPAPPAVHQGAAADVQTRPASRPREKLTPAPRQARPAYTEPPPSTRPTYDAEASEKLRVCLEKQGSGGMAACLGQI